MAATQWIYAYRHSQDNLLGFKLSIRMGKKGDISYFECGMVVGARRAWTDYFRNRWSTGIFSSFYREWSEKEKISSERQLCGWKCFDDVRRKMARLVELKATVTQISTRYNWGEQIGYSSKRSGNWKGLPNMTILDFCCNIRMVGSEFGINNTKAWVHPAL